ncbi:hypothetical protein FQA39_LY18993 [Lamprigera yunnana]|nr:hypothetical protein FQA39_LY18993 [Lamprigera yunnana]
MDIVVNEDLKAYIDPLTPEEYAALERSILAEGCRDALVLWGDVLVDGHNRYGICQKHGLPFNTVQNTHFQSMADVHLWMIDQHLGRRSVSELSSAACWRCASARSEARKLDKAIPVAAQAADGTVSDVKSAAPELVHALKAGDISINAAAVVATLPREEQQAAAQGGKDELKQAVKRVREAKRKPQEDKSELAANQTPAAAAHGAEAIDAALEKAQQQISELRARVQELEAENAQLGAASAGFWQIDRVFAFFALPSRVAKYARTCAV